MDDVEDIEPRTADEDDMVPMESTMGGKDETDHDLENEAKKNEVQDSEKTRSVFYNYIGL